MAGIKLKAPDLVKDLKEFLFTPGNSYFSGNTKYEKNPERKGFFEITSRLGNYFYRDSFAGHIKSRGTEIVRFRGKPVWSSHYGGGMVKGFEKMSEDTFEFLKEAFRKKHLKSTSLRGPINYIKGDWEYRYKQEGNYKEFSGYEEIYYKGKQVFFHHIIGGLIVY